MFKRWLTILTTRIQKNSVDYRRYLYAELHWKSYLPLCLQRLFQRRPIYLCLGDADAVTTFLHSCNLEESVSQTSFPSRIGYDEKQIIITCPTREVEKLTQKLLSRFTRLLPLAGIVLVADARTLMTPDAMQALMKQYQQLPCRLRRTKTGVFITGLNNLRGTHEAYVANDVGERLVTQLAHQTLNVFTTTIRQIDYLAWRYMQRNIDTLANARLELFLGKLKKLNSTLRATTLPISQVSFLTGITPQQTEKSIRIGLQQLATKTNKRYVAFMQYLVKYMTVITCFILLGLFGNSYVQNQKKITVSQRQLIHYQASFSKNKFAPVIAALQLHQVYAADTDSIWLHMGLYQGKKVKQLVKPLYDKQLKQHFLPILQATLAKLLAHTLTEKRNVSQALSTYLMLAKPRYYDAKKMLAWLTKNHQQINDPYLLGEQAKKILYDMGAGRFPTLDADVALVNKAQYVLPSLAQQIQDFLKDYAQENGEADLRSQLSTAAIASLPSNKRLAIKLIYTKDGYQRLFLPHVIQLLKQFSKQHWAYRRTLSNTEIRRVLFRVFADNYIAAWHKLINSIHITTTMDLNAALALTEVASQRSAFWQQLPLMIAGNTNLLPAGKGNSIDNKVSHAFQAWHSYVSNTDTDAHNTQLQKKFASIHRYLLKIITDDDINRQAYMALKEVFEKKQGIAVFDALDPVLKAVPAKLSTWISEARWQIVNAMMISAGIHLKTIWQQQVKPHIGHALIKFPFKRNSKVDISPAKFTVLFNPDGLLPQFLQAHVATFINLDNGEARLLYRTGILLNDDEKENIVRVGKISQYLFDAKTKLIKVKFALQPVRHANNLKHAKISLLGKTLTYSTLTKQNFLWPSSNDKIEAEVTWQQKNGKLFRIQTKGIWSWLRLLQSAKITPTQVDNVWNVRFSHGDEQVDLRLFATPAMNLILSGGLNNVALPK